MRVLYLAILLLGAFQTPSKAFARSGEQCELHIWSTANINAIKRTNHFDYEGIFYAFDRELTLQDRMKKLLSQELQRRALEETGLLEKGVLQGRRLIWHDEPSRIVDWTDKSKMEAAERYALSTSDCYTELHYNWVTFLDQPTKDVLQSGWVIRHFGAGATPEEWAVEGGYEKSPRLVWTDEEPEERARQTVIANIGENFRKFLTRRKVKRVLKAMSADVLPDRR